MAYAADQIRNDPSCNAGCEEAAEGEVRIRDGYRLRRARIRLLGQSAAGTTCTLIFYLLLFQMFGPAFAPYWRQTGLLLMALIVIPLWMVEWWNWVQARRGVAELGAAGTLSKTELALLILRRMAMRDELNASQPYIDVMHDQIGDSLAESEREVMEVIEQIGFLNAKANQQRQHIALSIQSGRDLTESTRTKVENNRQIIAAIEMQLEEQNHEFTHNFERIHGMANEIASLTTLIKVITSIAQKTNLLALNAEIEAARAGDAGRGFAVVAAEVRALAQRAAEAAKEIKGLISSSTTQVNLGVKLVNETGKALERIMAQVAKVNAVIVDIAATAKEQATGLEGVDVAIRRLDQLTQQNATMAEETTETASHRAGGLDNARRRYRSQ